MDDDPGAVLLGAAGVRHLQLRERDQRRQRRRSAASRASTATAFTVPADVERTRSPHRVRRRDDRHDGVGQRRSRPAPTHQGAFYRFHYDITPLLQFGEPNLLEVTVAKMSSNRSVNNAERAADYWVFGGIFRPVWLEARPARRHRAHRRSTRGPTAASSIDVFLTGDARLAPG